MSYFDSIQSFQQSAQAISQQTENAQQEYRDKKASSIEDKFDYVDKLMNESGGALGGLGGGYHIGRKMYKKVMTAKAKAQKAVEDAKSKVGGNKDNGTGQSTDATSNDTAPQEHSKANGDEDTQGGDQIDAKTDTTKVDTSQGEGGEVGGEDLAKPPTLPPAEGEVPLDPISVARAGKKPASLDDSGTDLFQEQVNKPLLDQFTDSGSNISDAFTQAGMGGKKPMTKSNPETDNGGPAEEEAGGTPHDADVPQTAPKSVDADAPSDFSDTILGKASGIKNKVGDAINDIKGQAKGAVEKVVGSDTLEAVGGVMDFLGPVGEIVGAGLALGSFFHNIFDKKKKEAEEKQAENKQSGIIGGQGGISTASLQMANLKSNVVGTLV